MGKQESLAFNLTTNTILHNTMFEGNENNMTETIPKLTNQSKFNKKAVEFLQENKLRDEGISTLQMKTILTALEIKHRVEHEIKWREGRIMQLSEWQKRLGVIKNPDLHVWIVKNEKDRMQKLDDLLSESKRTVIFSDEIQLGKIVSKKYDIPFIYGDSKDRMNTMRTNKTFVMSRVGDEGISLPDLERVIEISFLKGSRRQELQRFTRILHSKNDKVGEGHVIFDPEQYTLYHKRLFGVMDRGFKIILHREGIADKIVHNISSALDDHHSTRTHRVKTTLPKTPQVKQKEPLKEILDDPILSLPGIQKRMSGLNKAARNVIILCFKNPNKEYTTESMSMLLGYPSTNHLLASMASNGIQKLVDMELLEKVKMGQYRANQKLVGLSK